MFPAERSFFPFSLSIGFPTREDDTFRLGKQQDSFAQWAEQIPDESNGAKSAVFRPVSVEVISQLRLEDATRKFGRLGQVDEKRATRTTSFRSRRIAAGTYPGGD